jgi:hypothetical protein
VSDALALSDVAKAGFIDLRRGRETAESLSQLTGCDVSVVLAVLGVAAEPDVAASTLSEIFSADPELAVRCGSDRAWF